MSFADDLWDAKAAIIGASFIRLPGEGDYVNRSVIVNPKGSSNDRATSDSSITKTFAVTEAQSTQKRPGTLRRRERRTAFTMMIEAVRAPLYEYGRVVSRGHHPPTRGS